MQIGITGASGFIGTRVSTYLREHGHDVVALGRSRPANGDDFIPFTLEGGVDSGALSHLDTLIHLAYDFEPTAWDEIYRVNVEGSIDLFDAADAADVDVVQVSTLSAFPGCRSKYGRAKLALETEAFNRGYRVIRPGLVFGKETGNVLGGLQSAVNLSPVIPVPAGGPYVHYLCHYEDLAELLRGCCTGDVARFDRPIIAASDRGRTFRDILRTMALAQDKSIYLVPVPMSLAYYGLRGTELLGLNFGLRSDSVIGLVASNPNPDFEPTRQTGVSFREFTPKTMEMGFSKPSMSQPDLSQT